METNDVLIVSPRNYFVFTPMLAAASVGTVEYRSILEHIRSANPILRFYQGACEDIDVDKHQITVRPVARGDQTQKPFAIPYDVLVVAVGLRPSARGVPGVYEHCLFLKGIEDARRLRTRVTECFERADLPNTSDGERRRLLTFVVVGGGPTGCELCGELSDFLQNDLRRFYPRLEPLVRIFLVHRGRTILPSFGQDLQRAAFETLTGQGIKIMTSSQVSSVAADAVVIKPLGQGAGGEETTLSCGLCVWSAGQRSQDIADNLRQQIPEQQELSEGAAGPVFVDEWLRVKGVPDGSVIALGDCAAIAGAPALPQTAQVAAQQGAFVARLLNRRYDLTAPGPPTLPPEAETMRLVRARWQTEAPAFSFLDLGRLAYLGEDKAVAEVSLGNTAVSSAAGLAAFLLWRSVYVVKQVSLRNRVLVLFDWVKSKVFGRDLTRF